MTSQKYLSSLGLVFSVKWSLTGIETMERDQSDKHLAWSLAHCESPGSEQLLQAVSEY